MNFSKEKFTFFNVFYLNLFASYLLAVFTDLPINFLSFIKRYVVSETKYIIQAEIMADYIQSKQICRKRAFRRTGADIYGIYKGSHALGA